VKDLQLERPLVEKSGIMIQSPGEFSNAQIQGIKGSNERGAMFFVYVP